MWNLFYLHQSELQVSNFTTRFPPLAGALIHIRAFSSPVFTPLKTGVFFVRDFCC
jgi:hypothetical protein